MPPKPRRKTKPPPVLKPETWFFEERTITSVGDTRYWVPLGTTAAILLSLVLCVLLVYSNIPVDPPPHVWEAARAEATHVAVAYTGMARMSGTNYEVFIIGVDKEGLQEIASVHMRKDGTVIKSYRIMRGTPLPGIRVMFGLGVAGTVACLVLAWRFRRVMAAALRRPILRPPANMP